MGTRLMIKPEVREGLGKGDLRGRLKAFECDEPFEFSNSSGDGTALTCGSGQVGSDVLLFYQHRRFKPLESGRRSTRLSWFNPHLRLRGQGGKKFDVKILDDNYNGILDTGDELYARRLGPKEKVLFDGEIASNEGTTQGLQDQYAPRDLSPQMVSAIEAAYQSALRAAGIELVEIQR